jgi:hypothetical protein
MMSAATPRLGDEREGAMAPGADCSGKGLPKIAPPLDSPLIRKAPRRLQRGHR